jgi:hypothetical protein
VTPSRNSFFPLMGVLFFLSCQSGGLSTEEKREFEALEKALATHGTSASEDRPIRLQELEDVQVHSPRMQQLKEVCLASRKTLLRSERLVDKIKADAMELETLIAEARARAAQGEVIDAGQKTALKDLSDTANTSKSELDREMAKAKEFLDSCQKNRFAFRALIIENR